MRFLTAKSAIIPAEEVPSYFVRTPGPLYWKLFLVAFAPGWNAVAVTRCDSADWRPHGSISGPSSQYCSPVCVVLTVSPVRNKNRYTNASNERISIGWTHIANDPVIRPKTNCRVYDATTNAIVRGETLERFKLLHFITAMYRVTTDRNNWPAVD